MDLQQVGNTLELNPLLFCQQTDKNILWWNELLNMFFHKCSYKSSCFSELAYNLSVFVIIYWSAAWDSKKNVFKRCFLLWILCFWFWSYTPSKLLLKFHYRYSYCSFFCATSAAFLATMLRRRCPSNKPFVTVIDWYILAIQQTITHEDYFW